MRKLQRRLKFLTSKHCYKTLSNCEWCIQNPYNTNAKEIAEIRFLFSKLNITDEAEIENIWMSNYIRHSKVKRAYSLSPIRERKDNKTSINYSRHSCNSNRNKIRLPKKCRKTAWKRFFKLFPFMKEQLKENA